jgi:hypothetical protein
MGAKTPAQPRFRPIDLRRESALRVAHRADATACSDGNPDRFFSKSGPGGERYLQALASAIQDLPGGCVRAVLDGRIIGQIEMMRDRSDPAAAKVSLFYLVAEWRAMDSAANWKVTPSISSRAMASTGHGCG